MATTYKAIATVTVGSGGAANIEFTSIPQTYTDLCIVLSGRGTQALTYAGMSISFNGSTANRSIRQLYGSGSTVTSFTDATNIYFDFTGANATANTFGNAQIYIPNYTSSNNKSVSIDAVTENNATEAWAELYAGLWANSAAITSLTFTPLSGTIVQHSTATLYGIKNS